MWLCTLIVILLHKFRYKGNNFFSIHTTWSVQKIKIICKCSRSRWSGHRRAYSTLHIILAIGFYGAELVVTHGVDSIYSVTKDLLIDDWLGCVARCQGIVATDAQCQAAHILGNLVVDYLCIDLRRANVLVAKHLRHRLDRHSVCQGHRSGKGVARQGEKKMLWSVSDTAILPTDLF